MNRILKKASLAAAVIALTGCAVTTAKQTYRTEGGDEMFIAGRLLAGQVAIYINGDEVIGKTPIFAVPMEGIYKENKVVAMCKHTKHFFSVENECDIYINSKFAVNLYLR
jgi:hypothetical protein